MTTIYKHRRIIHESWVTRTLNRMPFVRWDRFVAQEVGERDAHMTVYGWIDRDGRTSDFVVLHFNTWDEVYPIVATTSSAQHSREIQKILYDDDTDHTDCERVEEHFPNVKNAVRLQPSSSLV